MTIQNRTSKKNTKLEKNKKINKKKIHNLLCTIKLYVSEMITQNFVGTLCFLKRFCFYIFRGNIYYILAVLMWHYQLAVLKYYTKILLKNEEKIKALQNFNDKESVFIFKIIYLIFYLVNAELGFVSWRYIFCMVSVDHINHFLFYSLFWWHISITLTKRRILPPQETSLCSLLERPLVGAIYLSECYKNVPS